MITLFFSARKVIIADVLLKNRTFNQPFFVASLLLNLKKAEKYRSAHRQCEALQWIKSYER
jgi:hypothetical protein